ncbi:alpha/beta hydrolase [Actinoplanes sp. NPDC024001]|uniref:alpha/beta fold hydrolase n=1 Tax=Actinoplanes sp. NPDC024001 TaxID=3154598 RepID=UPI0033C4E8EB
MPIYTGSDGTPLHYDDSHPATGEDLPPLITLAGGAARHPGYLGDLAGLSSRCRLVVPHLRGVGNSPEPSDDSSGSYWRQAEDLERLREHLGLDRLLLAGHSAGTRLATAYAARFPQRLAGLVLITPPATHLVATPPDAEELIARRLGDPVFAAARAAAEGGPDLSDDDRFNDWHRRCAPLGYAAWGPAEQAHAAVGRWSLAAALAYFSVAPPEDFAGRLGRVTAPVLVVAGEVDCLTGLAPVVALADLFPAGRAAVIERCGHYPWVERPDEFRRVLDAHLGSLIEVDHHFR